MSGMKPFFLSGANAKIRVNNQTIAFCTNLSYSVTVNTAEPTVLGMYEASSLESLGYKVSGSFTVIRYVADIKTDIGGTAPHGAIDNGNGLGTLTSSNLLDKLTTDGRAHQNLDPSKLHKGTGFDIEIFQKFENGQRAVAKIRYARITKADFNLSVRGAATQTFNFVALYADEDSFQADFSGQGQQFS